MMIDLFRLTCKQGHWTTVLQKQTRGPVNIEENIACLVKKMPHVQKTMSQNMHDRFWKNSNCLR
jgi:hypothetical protein